MGSTKHVIADANYEISEDYKKLYKNAISELVKYLKNYPKIETLIIGLSGGVDSALTAAIAHEAVKITNRKLIGYSLPIISNDDVELWRAMDIGKEFCDIFLEVDLGDTALNILRDLEYDIFRKYIAEDEMSFDEKVRFGNIKARTRMMFLFDRARKYNGMVLSTDNFTELMLGFWTLHGDVGNFGPIQNMWKTEVYGVVKYLTSIYCTSRKFNALLACYEAKPTDGLGVSDSDLDQLLPDWKGSSIDGYKKIDEILHSYMRKNEYKDHPIIKRMHKTEFKRNDPMNVTRYALLW